MVVKREVLSHRDSNIIVYKDKNTGTMYCRICCIDAHVGSHVCELFTNSCCCSFSDRIHWNENFHFDNTKHIIILSSTTCILCLQLNKICHGGIETCQHHVDRLKDKTDIFRTIKKYVYEREIHETPR